MCCVQFLEVEAKREAAEKENDDFLKEIGRFKKNMIKYEVNIAAVFFYLITFNCTYMYPRPNMLHRNLLNKTAQLQAFPVATLRTLLQL